MPTARPSITPSTGVTDDMSTTLEKASEPATPTPTPMSDVMTVSYTHLTLPTN